MFDAGFQRDRRKPQAEAVEETGACAPRAVSPGWWLVPAIVVGAVAWGVLIALVF